MDAHDGTVWSGAAGGFAGDERVFPVRPGQIIGGKYRIDGLLGCGAMGFVTAATHLQLGQHVAIKLILPQVLGNPDIVQRFLREARAAARLSSDHVVRVHDVGAVDDGTPYIVMEVLTGRSLAGLLADEGPLDPAVATDYVLQACDAIAEAHQHGIVHRDLKPENLFLATGSHGKTTLKVLDFGISKVSSAGDLRATATSTMIGSPAYMSPEQMRAPRSVDGRSDIWSLGIVLWELVSGKVPFCGETITDLCLRITLDPLPPLPALPNAPPGFETALRRCLEKEPGDRYATIADLAAALAPFAPGAPVERRRRPWPALLGAALIVLGGLGAGIAWGLGDSPAPPPPIVLERAPPPPPLPAPAPPPPASVMPAAEEAMAGLVHGLASFSAGPPRRAVGRSKPVLPTPVPPPRPPSDPDAPAGDETPERSHTP